MALIKCPRCGRQISDQAACCPECGSSLTWVEKDKKSNKKAVGIILAIGIAAIVIIVTVMVLAIYRMTTVPKDVILSSTLLGEQRDNVVMSMESLKDSHYSMEKTDWYKDMEFFGMTCQLVYYYDDNGLLKQISYIKWIEPREGEEPEDYQKNIDALIEFYTEEYDGTKNGEWERVDGTANSYEYTWWDTSKENKYILQVKEDEIIMSVLPGDSSLTVK